MIRSKGEAGTGNIVEAVRHLRSIVGDMRKLDPGRLGRAVRLGQAPAGPAAARAGGRRDRLAAGAAVLRRRHRHACRRRAGDAARRRGRVRRLGHLQERRPGAAGQGDRRGDDALPGPRHPRQGQPWPRHADDRHRHGRARPSASRSVDGDGRLVALASPQVAQVGRSLALQGAFGPTSAAPR